MQISSKDKTNFVSRHFSACLVCVQFAQNNAEEMALSKQCDSDPAAGVGTEPAIIVDPEAAANPTAVADRVAGANLTAVPDPVASDNPTAIPGPVAGVASSVAPDTGAGANPTAVLDIYGNDLSIYFVGAPGGSHHTVRSVVCLYF